jgi:hypothetical protein
MEEKKLFNFNFSSTQLFLCVEIFSRKLLLLSNFSRKRKKKKEKRKEL